MSGLMEAPVLAASILTSSDAASAAIGTSSRQTKRRSDSIAASVPERLLQQGVQIDAPDLVVMAIATIFAPEVFDAFFRKRLVERAAAVNRVVLGARAEEDELV